MLSTSSTVMLSMLVYNMITSLSYKDMLSRFGFLKPSRRDFYECGFKPQTQKPPRMTLQFLLMCVFFLLYDMELVYLFPFVSSFSATGLYDLTLLVLFFMVLFLSLSVDYERHALYWQE